jgi:hypothetical protein
MRLVVRHIVVGLLIAGMLYMPANAASEKPLGLVIQAQLAHLDSADAAIGTTVYSGDALDTQEGGTLRLKVGASQLYLLSGSAATFAPSDSGAHVNVIRGTVGILSINPNQIELETSLGTVHAANGSAAYGQVRIIGPEEMIVSAYRGNLVIDRDDEEHVVEAGKSYDVKLEPESEPASQVVSPTNHRKRRRLALILIIVGGEALTGYILWQEWSESCHDFKGC